MAKSRTSTNGKPTTVMGQFRSILLANPQLIKKRSNARLIELYLQDFPGRKGLTKKEKGALANVKSHLRRKKRRKKAEELDGAAQAGRTVKVKVGDLETLEFGIDDCYILARKLDPVGLGNVIRLLRKARNEIILKQE
jgi:hypothetical protein